MTVFVEYAPRQVPVKETGFYTLGWESAGKQDIEIYEINSAEGRRERVRPQDYNISYRRKPESPINEGGNVQFSRPHPEWVKEVAIERNTLIDQTVDFPDRASFNGRMIEFALDKHTMIAQELAQRKCAVVTQPITQEIVFTAYDDFRAAEINFAIQKLLDILQEIRDTAADCHCDPEET